ncbi:MAG: MFS transporter [Acidobacteria bacterium]|nr:MFS transporter [Acidobacteriota bacterium]
MPFAPAAPTAHSAPATRYRWWILSLLFFATTVNYLDRILLGFLYPIIRDELHINEQQYGYVQACFSAAYTIGFLIMGKFIDKVGTRIGYLVSLVWWSVAAALHATAGSTVALGFWRAVLGVGEAGNFPAAIKSVTEWFPKQDRAFATGIFNAGSNVASMIGPPAFAMIAAAYGWRMCFLLTAALGIGWVVLWVLTYQRPEIHPRVNDAERAYILGDAEAEAANEPTVGWAKALTYKQTWGFALAKFLTDPVWWFYLYWLPPYLYDVRKFNMTEIAWALPFIYLMADFGSVGGGWISGYLMRRGWPNGKARKTAMALCAVCMPIGALSVLAGNPVLAVVLISLATSGHQGWSANLYTTATDVFPKAASASVTGIGGCLGGLGGVIFSSLLPGYIVTHFGYTPIFLIMGSFHLIGLLVVHLLLGDMRRLQK